MLIWYLARGAGIAAYLALSIGTGVGALATRRGGDPSRRAVQQYVHRAAALSGLALLVLHIVTLLADSYAHVGVRGLLPFGSGYRPLAVTLGVLAVYTFVAVAVTGILRSRLAVSGRAVALWRRIHLLAYAAWAMAAFHFYLSGTDSHRWWAIAVLLVGIAMVVGGLTARLTGTGPIRTRREAPAPIRVSASPAPVRVPERTRS